QAVEARLLHAHVGQEGALVGVVEVGDFRFNGGADGDDGGVLGLGVAGQLVQQGVVGETRVGDVGDEHGGLGRDQAQGLDDRHFVGVQAQGAHRLAFV